MNAILRVLGDLVLCCPRDEASAIDGDGGGWWNDGSGVVLS